MKNLMLFQDQQLADKLRDAGFCVIKQTIGGSAYYATERSEELDALMCGKFAKHKGKILYSDKLFF